MISYNENRVRKAVQYLVDTSYFKHHVRRLQSTVDKPRALPFKDDAEPLNELLVVGRQNRRAMEDLIALAEFKRDDRNDYQRQYMAAKRRRDRKVIALEEWLTEQKLNLTQRQQVLLKQYEIWNRERDRLIAGLSPTVTFTERNQQLKEFWQRKECEVDQLLEEASRQSAKGSSKSSAKKDSSISTNSSKYRIVKKPKPTTAMSAAFEKARRKTR